MSIRDKIDVPDNQWSVLLGRTSIWTYVFVSPEFKAKVDEKIMDASNIIRDANILDVTSRARFGYLNAKLTQLSINLAQFSGTNVQRDRPFAVHFAGAPGCGKSLLASKFLRDSFGYTYSDIWTRELNTSFWNGYINQRCVMIDEFLCGSTTKRDEVALEYLQLVSDSTFQPNMASIDQPLVGVKGTPAKPEVVLTANNTPFDVVSSVNSNALQRRRSVVVHMRVIKGTKLVGKNVDMSCLTDDQLRNVSWAEFTCVDGTDDPKTNPYTNQGLWGDYETMVKYVKAKYDEYKVVVNRLQESKQSVKTDISPALAIKKAIARARQQRDEGSLVQQVLGSTFPMIGQGTESPRSPDGMPEQSFPQTESYDEEKTSTSVSWSTYIKSFFKKKEIMILLILRPQNKPLYQPGFMGRL